MIHFKKLNTIFGWFVFLISALVYLLTMEPTVSLWDCGEFISTAYKMEVGHPPGAPFFMILAKFFSLFAGNDVTKVAVMVNVMSSLVSAATIMFLFWTITHFAKKLVVKSNKFTLAQTIAIIGSGLVGSLAYTFSDTFWFSAVEGEVYALSSFFTAVVFWSILKWENVADKKHANRWLILIFYLMGLSIGVHLLNLLAIPSIVFVYYFKKHKVSRSGIIAALGVSMLLIGVFMVFIIRGLVSIAFGFEKIFVNSFNLPFNSGSIFYLFLLLGVIIGGLYYTHKHKKVLLNTIIIGFTVILVGYSSFAIIIIRSSSNLPMNQNTPNNLYSLLSYLNREQYGDFPLLYGQSFNSPIADTEVKSTVYAPQNVKGKDRYVKIDEKIGYKYRKGSKTFFPRMYSSEGRHLRGYKYWTGYNEKERKGKSVKSRDGKSDVYLPTMFQNIKYFFTYQINHMYIRYFMWNFAGRQNDIQGHGGILKGNWISGIPPIDNIRLGDQNKLPSYLKENKGNNKYYFFPLILGILGILFQLKKENKKKNDFVIIALLFFFTGIAIVMYLNQPPYQPRERDYAYAGSFYAFSIWIGIGVLYIYDLIKIANKNLSAIISTILSLFLVPGIMAKENWNDHDRSTRYSSRDFACAYLDSCAPNAILFTNGDNDTFPLWYVQEVEGYRTDVRVCNLSYLQTDWYIELMKRKFYKSDALPISMTKDQFGGSKRNLVYVVERTKQSIELKKALEFVASDNIKTKLNVENHNDYFPTKNLKITIDSAKVMAHNVVSLKNKDKIVKTMDIKINKNYITKNHLTLLDILATSDWERPVYISSTVGSDNYMGLNNYLQLEGFAYRIVPINYSQSKTPMRRVGGIDTDIMYKNMMEKFQWRNLSHPNLYLNEDHSRMALHIRYNAISLAEVLVNEGKKDSAINVLDYSVKLLPHRSLPYANEMMSVAILYYRLGNSQKANDIVKILFDRFDEESRFYNSLNTNFAKTVTNQKSRSEGSRSYLLTLLKEFKQDELFNELQIRMPPIVQ